MIKIYCKNEQYIAAAAAAAAAAAVVTSVRVMNSPETSQV